MLKYLNVSRFAIIENLEVTFDRGFNVLTGETGAGKSLLIDAIGLLLGDRAKSDIIRSGAEDAEVTAIFEPLNDTLKAALDEHGIPRSDEEMLIKRVVKKNSGNIIKVNGEIITLQTLKSLTKHLADIHTQHDTKRLFTKENYLFILDMNESSILPLKKAYQEARTDYLAAFEAYKKLTEEKDAYLERLDMLKYQDQEITSYDLKPGELETIESEINTLKNFDKIFQSLKDAHDHLEDSGALAHIYDAASALETIQNYDQSYQDQQERLHSAYYDLDDIKSLLFDKLENLDFDPDTLESLETRKHELDTLRRKYHKELDELHDYHDKIKAEIAAFDNYDETLNQAYQTLEKTHASCLSKAQALSKKRQELAHDLAKNLREELSDLALQDARFKIEFSFAQAIKNPKNTQAFKKTGIDSVEFMLSFNKGEALKPLQKIASGGELSRMMLALKTLLANQQTINLMIFDEIDSGVSGYVASQVAKKMRNIAKQVQVLSITHLPQVAAKADTHYKIYKTTTKDETLTHVDKLDHQGRIETLAAMISGDQVSERAKKSAEDLLK